MNWITGISRPWTANTSPWQIPGKLKTLSTMTIPPARYRKPSPMTWMVGAIALVLALYMAAILPVNATGLVLIALALLLFIFDIYAPTHGVLTVGGIISFLIGSLMLFNRTDPLFRLSLSYIIPATLVTAGFFVFVVGKGLRAQRLPVKAGTETMVGKTVTALTPIDSRGGRIFVEGEYWNVVSDTLVQKGELVEIAGIQGLTLKVRTKKE